MAIRTFDEIYRNAPREQKERLLGFRATHPKKHLTVSGLEWEYIVGGQGPEALVVCVGGARTSDPAFRLIFALEEEYRVIALNYPCADRMGQLVEGIRAILEAESVENAHIWGTSLGGMLAQCFARKYPELVKKMIVGDTLIPNEAWAEKERKQGRLLRFVPLRPIVPWVRSRMNKVITSDIADENERAFWKAFIEEWLTQEYSKEWLLASNKCMIDFCTNYRFRPEDLADQVGRILIVDSDTDRTIGAQQMEKLKATYPHAQTYTFHDAGHVPVITHEKEYISLIRDFLKQQHKS